MPEAPLVTPGANSTSGPCVLLMTVGTGTAGFYSDLRMGLVNTLNHVSPRLFWLVPSTDPKSIEIANDVRVFAPAECRFQPWEGEPGQEHLFRAITDPDNLWDCREAVREVLMAIRPHLRRGERLLINPTSGTAQMRIGAAFAGVDAGVDGFVFTVGERADGVVITDREQMAPFDAERFHRERAWREADRLFQAGAYRGAALLLEPLGASARAAFDMARCLDAWLRLNYRAGFTIASAPDAPPAVAALKSRLGVLAAEPELRPAILADLFAGADALLAWGDALAALSRLYRAAEFAAKLRLSEAFAVRPDRQQRYQLADIQPVAPEQARRLGSYASPSGSCRLQLQEAFRVLREANDPLGSRFFRQEHERTRAGLELRHATVFGHGTADVQEAEVRGLRLDLAELLGRCQWNLPVPGRFPDDRPRGLPELKG